LVNTEQHILLIDDEAIVRESVAGYLEDSGYSVSEAGSGEEGLTLFDLQLPDLVLCDIKMPGMDGFELLEAIKQRSADTPVIMISGAGVMSDVVEALRRGASDYLVKPILDLAMLEHAVRRSLDQGALRKENQEYRQQLERANLELRETLAGLQQDQQAGRQVQFKMLPPAEARFGDCQFNQTVVPSLYLSGDFIDFFTVGDRHVSFFIADVSGHGASSAFVTVLLKNLFARKRSNFSHGIDEDILSPVAMLECANRELIDTDVGKHVTMVVGVLDMENNQLSYSVAGHLPLPMLTENGKSQFLRAEGMPVGLFAGAKYTEKTEKLPEKFVLSFFSDGILEVLPAKGLLAQEQYLLEKLSPGCRTVNEVRLALGLGHVMEIPDDIALLTISKS
jgi:serine phosphatase RsbU (regulator of sigma subunit)